MNFIPKERTVFTVQNERWPFVTISKLNKQSGKSPYILVWVNNKGNNVASGCEFCLLSEETNKQGFCTCGNMCRPGSGRNFLDLEVGETWIKEQLPKPILKHTFNKN